MVFGAVLGYGVFVMMRGIDQYQVEVMLTLALVIGGAALAARLHVSAPIAMVVAGLIIGNHGRTTRCRTRPGATWTSSGN